MTSSGLEYHEDLFTLQGMIEHFECPEELIREIQNHGLMLPEMVKFGSAEIEIYSPIDVIMCRRVTEAQKELDSLSQAIDAAQAHIVELYRVAHGGDSIQMNDSPDLGQLRPGPQRKKLFLMNELLDAVGICEEQFREIAQHTLFVFLRLVIPGKTIEYYGEHDYLKLRYMLTLMGQGCPLEDAAGLTYDWPHGELR
jgi:hypothetical protein